MRITAQVLAARRACSRAAFTLIEIMIAMSLLMMIVIAIYNSWNAILKGSHVALDAAASAQRTRISMRTLEKSLLCACMFTKNQSYYTFDVNSDNKFPVLSFAARLPRSFPRSGKYGDFTVRRLEYTIESGADGKNNLVLRQSPILMDMDQDEKDFPLLLAKDVQQFTVEFIDAKTGDWVPEWDSTNTLPKEIRVTLGLGRLDQFSHESQEVAVRIIAIPSIAVRPEWQSPLGGAPSPNQNQNRNGGKMLSGANNGLGAPQ